MKNIKLFYKFNGLSGVLTTMMDIHFNLAQMNMHIPLCIRFTKEIYHGNVLKYISFMKKYDCKTFNETSECFIADTIIMSAQQFVLEYYFSGGIITDEEIQCEQLILLDSACFFVSNAMNLLDDLLLKINNTKSQEVIILCSSENKRLLEERCSKYNKIKLVDYFISFSEKRLNIISQIPITKDTMYADNYEESKRIKNFEVHEYAKYHYNRWMPLRDTGHFYENIGKLLFEFSILGKESFYSIKNKTMDDGMTGYMRALGLDDNINHNMIDYSNNIKDFFTFKQEDDVLWNLLK